MAATSVVDDSALPEALEAAEPPEARGLRRDGVRLMVSDLESGDIAHARFRDLPTWLTPGDVLVVNTSGTLNAALPATDSDGRTYELHLSTQLPGGLWSVEIREPGTIASRPYRGALAGRIYRLPDDGEVTVLAPYPFPGSVDAQSRLWLAALRVHGPLLSYLARYGVPIRYSYVRHAWPPEMYQTVFATEPGSAEMPSAARPFTHELVTSLVARGVQIAPVLLHTGVASLEDHEPPYEEIYRVTADTADRINRARRRGGRIVAVGTTVVRALETVADTAGTISPGEGWTRHVVSPERPVKSVDGLLTGLHEPRASHLMMLEQVVAATRAPASSSRVPDFDVNPLRDAYEEARRAGYLWHEFGDTHLILGRRGPQFR